MMFRRKSAKKSLKSKSKTPTPTSPLKEEVPMHTTTNSCLEPVLEEDDVNNEQDPWSEENFFAMAALYKLTEDQQAKVLEMRDRLGDVNHWKNDPYEVVRFLKECKYNVKSAEDKFRKMVHWRVEHNIDNYLETYGEPHPLFDYFPSVVLKGVDFDGDPVFVERSGAFDAYGFYKEFGTQGMVDFITWKREADITRQVGRWQTDYYEPTYGRRVGQFTAIIDVDGLNRNHMRAGLLPLLNVIARMTQDYYAGVAKRIIVLRAPSIFKMFWSLVKHFFDPCIRELVTFTTSADYLQVLDKYMDREILPPQLCPERGVGTFMPGFEHVRLEGGPITKEVIESCNKADARKLRSNSSDITETTLSCDASSAFLLYHSDDDTSSVEGPQPAANSAVMVVSGSLLGGGSYRGQAIRLHN